MRSANASEPSLKYLMLLEDSYADLWHSRMYDREATRIWPTNTVAASRMSSAPDLVGCSYVKSRVWGELQHAVTNIIIYVLYNIIIQVLYYMYYIMYGSQGFAQGR